MPGMFNRSAAVLRSCAACLLACLLLAACGGPAPSTTPLQSAAASPTPSATPPAATNAAPSATPTDPAGTGYHTTSPAPTAGASATATPAAGQTVQPSATPAAGGTTPPAQPQTTGGIALISPIPGNTGVRHPQGQTTPSPALNRTASPTPNRTPNRTATRTPSPAATPANSTPPTADSFVVLGPGAGGTMINPAINPGNDRQWIIGSDMSNTFISNDGGQKFTMYSFNGGANQYNFDPHNAGTIYVGGNALYRSTDNGQTWRFVFPSQRDVTGLVCYAEEGVGILTRPGANCPNGSIGYTAIEPTDPNTVYTITLGSQPTVYRSVNNCGSFTALATLPQAASFARLYADPASPAGQRVLVALTSAGMYRISATGEVTTVYSQELIDADFCYNAANGTTHYYVIEAYDHPQFSTQIKKSTDNGATWANISNSFTSNISAGTQRSYKYIRAASQNVLYAAVGPNNLNYGVIKSTNGGKTWAWSMYSAGAQPSNLTNPGWLETRYQFGWGGMAWGLAVSQTNPDLCIMTNMGTSYGTRDGGRTWQQLSSTYNAQTGAAASNGLDVLNVYGLTIDPNNRDHMFISYTDIGGAVSFDRGASWQVISRSSAVPASWSNTCYAMAFDPTVEGLCWSAWSNKHDMPLTRMFRSEVTNAQGGICVSTDGGLTWAASNSGLPANCLATDLVVDPNSPANNRTLYMADINNGVYRSTDNGRTWSAFNAGINESLNRAWQLTYTGDFSRLYLNITTQGSDFRDLVPGAVYYLDRGATRWVKLTTLPENNNVRALTAICPDPQDNNTLYASGWAYIVNNTTTYGGAYVSHDGGKTWRNIFSKYVNVTSISVDSRNANVLYLTTFDGRVMVSRDRGANWTEVEGFRFLMPKQVFEDPTNPNMIYVGTFGGGLWYGPLPQ